MKNKNLPKQQQIEADEMDNDDRQVGRILSRREMLALLGTSGVAMLVAGVAQVPHVFAQATVTATAEHSLYLPLVAKPEATATATPGTTPTVTSIPSCVVRPEVTEGPYFVDEMLNRSDIRSDPTTGTVKQGALFQLTFRVMQINSTSCVPLAGAMVDVWHCDALGKYSDEQSEGTAGQKFLRGYQVTDANGIATFTTIYPGWYTSRAVHIHFKIRTDSNYEFTSQLFFNESLTDQVHAQSPYASKGYRDTLNSEDNIYQDLLLLTTTQTSQRYAATFDVGLSI